MPTASFSAKSFRFSRLLLAIVCTAGLSFHLPAQEVTAQIRGTVADASGAIIAGANVKATNTRTGVAKEAPSEANGTFQFLQLPVGTYDVEVTKPGFQSFSVKGVKLMLNQQYVVQAELPVGAVNQTVQVEANATQVETTTTQLGSVLEAQKIVDLPLNGRNWTSLQTLGTGVVSSSDRFGSNFATNGSQSQQNSFLINGADSIDLPLNTPAIIPSPDAIAEFNLISSTINPEYGRNSGGILNAIIKSGTNQFHGDAFEFYRDSFLNGRNLFQATKPVFHQNQFGGTLGGPVWKDHTFFFASYQGTRNRSPEGTSAPVPVFSANQRNGVIDPTTLSGNSPFPLVGSNGATYPTGTPYATIFAGGQIPLADFNPISQKLLTYVPAPNTPGNLFSFNPIVANVVDQGIIRVDHTFSQRDVVWANLTFQNSANTETLPFTGATLPGFGDANLLAYKQATASWTHTFNPTTLNELRLSYQRFNYHAVTPQQSVLPSSLGFTGITPQNTTAAGIPYIGVTGYFDLGFSTNGPQPRIDETYQLTDSLTKTAGGHTMKFGFDGKRYNVNNPFYGNNNGNYSFGGSGAYSSGDAAVDFLLGVPDSYSQGSGGYIVARTYEYYAYAQDTWKVNQNLTLNYGAGYQIDTPLVNQHFGKEALNCFRPGEQSTIFPTAPQGLVFPGDKGCTDSGYYNHYDHIGPRFGFAYAPGSDANKKFVIRGGFGVYFNRVEEELTLQNLGAAPFSLTSPGIGGIGGTPSFADPYTDISTGQRVGNPFPFTPATKGSNVDFAGLGYLPLGINVINPNFTTPYAMNFNFNVQRELPSNIILQVSFVGALGRHLELTYEGDPITPAGAAACAVTPACVTDRATQHTSYPDHALYEPVYGTSGVVPYGSVGVQSTEGVSSYNSFQVSLRKALSHGLDFQASYTWSHAIDDGSGYENSSNGSRSTNPYNFATDKGDSSYDARQRFVISYSYELPHLSRYWNNFLTRSVLDGWHLAGITTLQTGFPVLLYDSNYRSLTCDSLSYYGCWDRPNVTGPSTTYDVRNSTLVNGVRGGTTSKNYYYYNPNSYALSPIGTLGNVGRNNFHGPGLNNTDLSLSKRIFLSKSEQNRLIELRLEAYNLFNHNQFSSPSGNDYSANFGRSLGATIGRTVQLGAKFYF